jgi:hypothetical protein
MIDDDENHDLFKEVMKSKLLAIISTFKRDKSLGHIGGHMSSVNIYLILWGMIYLGLWKKFDSL